MKFVEALEKITGNYSLRMTRKNWPYYLSFSGASGYLMLKARNELTAYVISEFDFEYQWEVEG